MADSHSGPPNTISVNSIIAANNIRKIKLITSEGSGVPIIIRNPIKIYIYFFKLFLLSVYSDTSRINMGRLTKIPEKIEIETISFAV